MVIGYSIAFTTNDSEALNKWIGGFKYFMLKPMTIDAVSPLAASIPESVYHVLPDDLRHHHPGPDRRRRLADRMKFSAFMTFMVGSGCILVYARSPIGCGAAAGSAARRARLAGGTVVHLNAGTAGLVCALVLGQRYGLGKENMAPLQSRL